jgi:hypothetical protein
VPCDAPELAGERDAPRLGHPRGRLGASRGGFYSLDFTVHGSNARVRAVRERVYAFAKARVIASLRAERRADFLRVRVRRGRARFGVGREGQRAVGDVRGFA